MTFLFLFDQLFPSQFCPNEVFIQLSLKLNCCVKGIAFVAFLYFSVALHIMNRFRLFKKFIG